jgi:hypothetical protein
MRNFKQPLKVLLKAILYLINNHALLYTSYDSLFEDFKHNKLIKSKATLILVQNTC